jgi:hypothetical protein
LDDDPVRYIEDRDYRRAVLLRDLVSLDNTYSARRVERYAVEEDAWDELPTRDLPSAAFTTQDADEFRQLGELGWDPDAATSLVPDELPQTADEWVALGERVFFEYPAATQPRLRSVVLADQAEELGMLTYEDEFVGMRVIEWDGEPRLASTCAGCHASSIEGGKPSGVMSNRDFDVGGQRLLAVGDSLDHENPVDATKIDRLQDLGPGRSDVSADEVFNPYAYPDWGGLADVPFLHHTSNWRHEGTTTLAIRVETVFITGMAEQARIPRVLSWALAEYIRSLPPPPPAIATPQPELLDRGQQVFDEATCSDCHVPPLYTSDRMVRVEEIGTDPLAGESPSRGTGFYRIPSLRGVGRTAPYLHHGAFGTLEEMFDPNRAEPGHPYGLQLDADDREALLHFLRTI